MRRLAVVVAAVVAVVSGEALAQEPVRLYAAGSLRAAMTAIATAFKAETGLTVNGTYGASGLLRDRIEKGEPAEIFASANMEHPQLLTRSGKLGPTALFTRNEMCALVNPTIDVTPESMLARMLDPTIRLGTSTPKADPSGDYAWDIFRKADAIQPGSYARLDAKAMQLTGGPNSPPPPLGRNVYGMLVDQGQADIFLTYCTNAVLARQETPVLRQVALPASLRVGADYGLGVAVNARPDAKRFADFVLSPRGQAILTAQGFSPIR
jgi:ABC-type molybdate transport system substrate-binding protein